MRTNWFGSRDRAPALAPRGRKTHRPQLQFERLEGRLVLATLLDGGTSTLTIRLATNESFGIQATGSAYHLTLLSDSGPTGSFVNGGVASLSDFTAGFGSPNIDLLATGIARYTTINVVDSGATGASVDLIDSGPNSYSTNINVTLVNSPAAQSLQIRKTTFVGTAGLNIRTTGDINVLSGGIFTDKGSISLTGGSTGTLPSGIAVEIEAPISSNNGAITLVGRGGLNASVESDGVRLINGGFITSGSGPVTITGTAGAGGGSGVLVMATVGGLVQGVSSKTGKVQITGNGGTTGNGVTLYVDSIIQSTGTGPGAAQVFVTGASTNGIGVDIALNPYVTGITSIDGNITIKGTTASTSGSPGVRIWTGSQIRSLGTGANAASITIKGTSTGTGPGVQLVDLGNGGGGATISTAATVPGTGGISINGSGAGGGGVELNSNTLLQSLGSGGGGQITVTGVDTGPSGAGNGDGVRMAGAGARLLTVDGSIFMTGTSSADDGLELTMISGGQIQATGTAAVQLTGSSTAVGVAGTGINLRAVAVATGSGKLVLNAQSASDYGVFADTSSLASTSGPITITSSKGPVQVFNTPISSAGAIRITTTDTAAQNDFILIQGTSSVSSTGANVTIRSGDDFGLEPGATLSAGGQLLVTADSASVDSFGVAITINGTFNSTGPALVQGGAFRDVITFTPVASSANTTLAAGKGNDDYIVAPAAVIGTVSIADNAGEGTDSLRVLATNNSDWITAKNNTVNVVGHLVKYGPNLESVKVEGQGGDDTFDVTPSLSATITIDGGDPVAPVPPGGGDSITFHTPAAKTANFIPGGPGDGTFQTSGGYKDVSYTNIETNNSLIRDVSASTLVKGSSITLDPNTELFVQTVTIKNTGSTAIDGPVVLVLDNLPTHVSLANANGTTVNFAPVGSPYINVTLPLGALPPGATTVVTLMFNNPMFIGISYTTRVLAGFGAP